MRPEHRTRAWIALLVLSLNASAPASEFRLALPGYSYSFPRDHGNHPEFKLEWWYFTGNLQDPQGKRFGYELTFFRTALEDAAQGPSRWQTRDLYPAHFAVSDLDGDRFFYFEKLNRTSPFVAGADPGRLAVWNENWSARMEGRQIQLQAAASGVSIQLLLDPLKPPVIHGRDGVSQKGQAPGRASHYYSLTRMATQGLLTTPDGDWEVNGNSWMDHEFGTNQLEPEQRGWDWFSIQMNNGEELMLFQIRREDGRIDRHSAGTLVDREGRATHLDSTQFQLVPEESWTSPSSGAVYPITWTLQIPAQFIDLKVKTVMPQQELDTSESTGIVYWEGAVEVTGSWKGREALGMGYLEMTGYAQQSRPRI